MSNKDMSREEIAEIEIGKTNITPPGKWFLVIAFLVTIFAIPLVQYVWELQADLQAGAKRGLLPKAFSVFSFAEEKDFDKFRQQETGLVSTVYLTRLLNSKTIEKTKKFESTIEEESWLLKTVGPSVENLLIGALGGGSQNVYCGRDGWLFFRPTIEYLTGRGFLEPAVMKRRSQPGSGAGEQIQPDPVKAIVDFRNQLAHRGIELVVLPSPAKATIYPERFSPRYENFAAPLHNPSYGEFVRRLESQGVRVLDPTHILLQAKAKEEMFLKTDTHWTPAGSELVARALADYLDKNRLLPRRTPASYVRVAGKAENAGDLAKMLKVSSNFGYGKQQVDLHPVQQSDGAPWAPSRDADILVLGDSYANIFSLDGMGWGSGSGLVQQLAYYLQRPVDSILANDNGSFTTRQQLGNELRRGQDRLAGKKVVIYEFATRELAVGNWKLVDLTPGKPAEPAATAEEAAVSGTPAEKPGQLMLEGVIEEITQPPRPGSTAYKDAVIAMHLKNVTVAGKPFKRSHVVMFTWGMRDNVVTASSRYKRGQRVALKVRPWGEVEQKYGSYQRIELQNDDAMLLDIYWLVQPEDELDARPVVRAASLGVSLGSAGEKVEIKQVPDAQVQAQPQEPKPNSTFSGDVKALFQNRLFEINKELEEKQTRVYPGIDGWLFSKQEIGHIVKGQFWGEAAQAASTATKPENRDPLPAILDFKQQLDGAGIELIVVPVPAKAHVYPDKLVEGIQAGQVGSGSRFDPAHQQFLTLLETSGIDYLDVTRLFLEARSNKGPAVFLQQDTHWSPYGMSLVARALKEKVDQRPWLRDLAKLKYLKKPETLKMKGDLADDLEAVTISRISQVDNGKEAAVASDRNSPILLLGDSHTLIFHSGGDMHAEGAGLPELLSYEFGLNIDLVGVRGSGATPARVELVRRRDNLKGKKVVIWCFTVREYTESTTGWQKLLVIRQPKTSQ